MSATAEAIQWKGNKKKDGTYPIKIRIMWKGESKYFPVKVDGKAIGLTEADWLHLSTGRQKGDKLIMKDAVRAEEARAKLAISKVTQHGQVAFSFIRFAEEFQSDKNHQTKFFEIFDGYLSELLNEGRIKTHKSYNNAKASFYKFLGRDIKPIDITPNLLKTFERYLLDERQVSRNTVAIYMRTIRLIYNLAASDQPYLNNVYPFARRQNEKNKYVIRTARGRKGDSLSKEQIRILKNSYAESGSGLWEAKLLFLFSYYCQGINFKDIALLRPENISNEAIIYVRHKTRNTEKEEQPIIVPLTENITEIMRALTCNLTDNDRFVFNILDPSMDLVQQEKAIQQKIKLTNQRLAKLCRQLELPLVTTYWARHSYASSLKMGKVDIEIIKEALGHSSVQTTQSYLKRFDIGTYRAANEVLEN